MRRCFQKQIRPHLRRVHPEPIVSLSKVVENDAASIVTAGREHDARRTVCLRRDPSAVESIADLYNRHTDQISR